MLLALAGRPATAPAEDFVVFRSSTAGEKAWIGGSARVQAKLGRLLFSERSKEGHTGSIQLASNLPRFRDGTVELDIQQVMAGTYSLQVLGFKQGGHTATADLVIGTRKDGRSSFSLGDLALPKEIDKISFQLLIGGVRGAAMKLNELVYTATLNETTYLADERFADSTAWTPEDIAFRAGTNGAVLGLSPSKRGGAILWKQRFDRRDLGVLVLDIPVVENGYVTAQILAFDYGGAYVGALDVMKNVTAGLHVAYADQFQWPATAEKFTLKIWLSGSPAVHARLARCILARTGPKPENPTTGGNTP